MYTVLRRFLSYLSQQSPSSVATTRVLRVCAIRTRLLCRALFSLYADIAVGRNYPDRACSQGSLQTLRFTKGFWGAETRTISELRGRKQRGPQALNPDKEALFCCSQKAEIPAKHHFTSSAVWSWVITCFSSCGTYKHLSENTNLRQKHVNTPVYFRFRTSNSCS